MKQLLCLVFLALGLTLAPSAIAEPVRDGPNAGSGKPSNILIIVTDDQGIDQVGAYKEHPNPPPTPNIDKLAQRGVLFRNAWASPTCSPSRGSILTGRLPSRNGLGSVIHPGEDYEMPLTEITIPRMLESSRWDWSTAAVGKWHLAGQSSQHAWKHPNLMGFDHFGGTIANIGEPSKKSFGELSYRRWEKLTNGKRAVSEVYATTDNVNDALRKIQNLPEPWLVYLAFNAPHAPWHAPPKRLHSQDVSPKSGDAKKYRAMVEAMDTEIGRLFREMGAKKKNTTIIFLSDNGTPDETTIKPWDKDRAKNTPYEGGVNVPLIVAGPQVSQPGSESKALVHVADVFATVAHIAGVGLGPDARGAMANVKIDGRSLVPLLRDPTREGRTVIHSEKHAPNGLGKPRVSWKISRNAELKLIQSNEHGYRLYDIRDGLDQEPALKPSELPPELRDSWQQLRALHEKRYGARKNRGDAPKKGDSGQRRRR